MSDFDIYKSYNEQVNPYSEGKKNLGSRADKKTRYYMYEKCKGNITLNEKERHSIELLKMALRRSKKPSVSCSFGIDSIVSLYLTRKALSELDIDPSDIDVVWNNTLNEFPETRMYAKKIMDLWNLRLHQTKPKKSLKQVIDDHGGVDSSYFFSRKGDRREGRPLSEKCCAVLKHEPMHRAMKELNFDLIVVGIRADESSQRKIAGLRDGEFFYSTTEWKSFVVRPILYWTEEDVWNYVKKEKIPYNDVYNNNMIKTYPKNIKEIVKKYQQELVELGIDVDQLANEQIQTVNRWQSIFLKKIGFKMFTPRVGCMMCPIPVKYGYLKWIRTYYPKVYEGMIYKLGYGKVLLEMIPDDVKQEIEFVLNIDLSAENAHEYLKEILEAKPCTFD